MAEDRLSDSSSADSHPRQIRACRSSQSSASLGCVADLVFWYLPVRTLVQCKVLSKEWRAWCDENLLQIAKERRKDESKSDWYFPLAFEKSGQRGKWYGIHQGTKEQDTLPGLDFLPCFSHRNGAPRFEYVLEAVSSGLLVLRKSSPNINSDLIVCNPLSKKWKRLPRHGDCHDKWMYHTHLELSDLPNEYRVIRVSRECISVYSSSTMRWVCAPFDRPYVGFYYVSSVCFEGHVYVLKMLDVVPLNSGTLRWRFNLRIYNVESGSYVTKAFTSSTVVTQDCNETNETVDRPRDPILVVCMGNLYAVVASCRAGRNHVKPQKRCETYVANCEFHIFSLMEEGRLLDGSWKHVVTVPVVLCSVKQDVVAFWAVCRNFSCVARSNMICLAWSSRKHRGDYLPINYLEYDVVSGLRTTYTSRAHHGQSLGRGCNMAYTPCLDVVP